MFLCFRIRSFAYGLSSAGVKPAQLNTFVIPVSVEL